MLFPPTQKTEEPFSSLTTESISPVSRLSYAIIIIDYSYLDGVVDLDVGVGETDGSAVVGDDVGDLVLADLLLGDLAELEPGLLGVDGVRLEAALNVIKHAEILAGLLNGDDVHESKGEPVVSSFSVVNFDIGTLVLADLQAFLAGEGVLKSVLEKNRKGKTFAELVGASGGAVAVHALKLIKCPMGGGKHALQVLLGSSCLEHKK